jgi:AcrR family transcriptional regulator
VSDQASKRKEKAAATAEQLLVAARDVFETRGYQATTVGAITEAANTAHGTFYLYFKNKEDAFAKVMASVTAEMYRETQPQEGDPREALAASTRNFFEVFRAHRGLWRCLLEGLHTSPAIEGMWLDLRRPFVDRIARDLKVLGSEGLVRPVDTDVAAHALGSMVEWFAFTHFELDEPSADEVTIDRAVETLTDLWYHSVFVIPPD